MRLLPVSQTIMSPLAGSIATSSGKDSSCQEPILWGPGWKPALPVPTTGLMSCSGRALEAMGLVEGVAVGNGYPSMSVLSVGNDRERV